MRIYLTKNKENTTISFWEEEACFNKTFEYFFSHLHVNNTLNSQDFELFTGIVLNPLDMYLCDVEKTDKGFVWTILEEYTFKD